jgi:hypothetical protein
MADYAGFQDYFCSRKRWIFSFTAVLLLANVADTLIKGLPYLETLGPVYYFRTVSCLVLSLAAIRINNWHFQAGFAIVALLCELSFIVTAHLTVG